MPIPVVCANCQTRLNAPDAAAGKKVKCPKCQAVMAVPAAAEPPPPAASGTPFDFGGGSPPPPRSAPPEPASPPPAAGGGGAFDFGAAVSAGGGGRSRGDREERGERGDRDREERGDRGERGERRRRRDEDDDASPPDRGDRPRRRPRDDEDDAGDDDRPRRRAQSGGSKSPLVLILGIAAVAFLMCCGGPIGVWFFIVQPKLQEAAQRLDQELKKAAEEAKKRNEAAGTGGGSLPIGWTKFEAPDKSVRAAFPGTPDDGGLSLQSSAVTGAKSWQYTEPDGSLACTLAVVKFRPSAKTADRERELKSAANGMTFVAKDAGPARTVDWLGGQAKETEGRSSLTDATVVTRSVVVGNTGYIAVVQHKNKADAVATFFNNVEALSK
ncbi:hypothetical protein J0H58_10345 [bacterium]|nr:hypothetical protein [bacterium]